MTKKLLELFGLEKKTEYENKYLDDINTKASIYMTVVIIVLELWMILRTFDIAFKGAKDTEWIVTHMVSYIILLTAGITVLAYSIAYLKGKIKNRVLGKYLRIFFSTISIAFGMYISRQDYAKGEQILTFLTMLVFVACLYAWRPIISLLLLTLSFAVFYIMIDHQAVNIAVPVYDHASVATQINFFIMWISVLMVSLSIYFQRLEEARKDERLENINKLLRKLAISDELTGISNKTHFTVRANDILAEEGHEKLLFIFLDISNFKGYNEKYGFEAGNELLKDTAQKIGELFPGELYARFSDDHFVILAHDEAVEYKLEQLKVHLLSSDAEIKISLKAGAYRPENKQCDPAIACDKARYACNTLRKSHKDFCLYNSEMEADLRRRQYIINNIDKAITKNYIQPHYQPVVWTNSKQICGVEALARWNDPEYGFLSPGEFIPVLEEYQQIHKLDAAIVNTVCSHLRSRLDKGMSVVPISVNFSRLDFEIMDVAELLEEAVKKYDIERSFIHVEITESALAENAGILKAAATKLKSLGYPIWLDDFGSGYSSLNVLKDFNFDVLKLDMKFLADLSDNIKAGIIIDSILKMAEHIGIHTLSEGVETTEEADFLKNAGCERLQGYLIGKPMSFEELTEKLDNGTYTISNEYL